MFERFFALHPARYATPSMTRLLKKNLSDLPVISVLLLILSGAVGSSAQEVAVPVQAQFPLFMKILTFDRNLKKRSKKEIVIGIVYQKKFRASLTVAEELEAAVAGSSVRSVAGIPVRCVPIDVGDADDLMEEVSRNGVNTLYVAPLRALSVKTVATVSRAKQIVTLTGVTEYVASGLSVGIGEKEGRPQILIGLSSAKAEGADFSSQLLKLARVFP